MLSRIIKAFIISLTALIFTISVYGAEITDSAEFMGIDKSTVTDNELLTHTAVNEFTITSSEPIYALYIEYNRIPTPATLNGSTPIAENGFLHEFIELDGEASVTLSYNYADICDIRVFGNGEIPSDVERWEPIPEGVDILLLATHSDDDQLFFAGLLPYYASLDNVRVAVAYFAHHYYTYNRPHELLHGLWHCGIKYYPETSPFPDGYSESIEGAKGLLSANGITDDDVTAFHKKLIERYKPLVAVLHDFNGEYGHGAHMHSTESFIQTVENGEYSLPEKIYVHLYNENPIVLDCIDKPLDNRNGKTAFQISQEAFGFHLSQHWTWFYTWIYGKSNEITSSTQISTYNPAHYGLYRTTVGEDTECNDLLENIVTYAEREKPIEPPAEETEPVESEPVEIPEETTDIKPVEKPVKEVERHANYTAYILIATISLILIIFTTTLMRKKK